ncbi:ubiquitin-like domain-containing protein [Streptomyces phytohabitans]|uniref:ubiquitin-like domain-containing protein n=1 Tax=Streptomyces phytohabitans TaxID=1150371 RepID=UPI00345C0CE9
MLPQALVVAFLAGGTSAFVAHDKAVTLTVDGHPRTLHTFADTVDELLAEEDVRPGAHDTVTPARGERLANGEEIAVRGGRPVALTLDGERRTAWTTARTVGAALREWGVRTEGAYVSAGRHARVDRTGTSLVVRTARRVTVLADGRRLPVRTNAATVGEAVRQAGVTLRGEDTLSVPRDGFPREGQTVTVLRIVGTDTVRDELIGFRTVRREDPRLSRGTELVTRAGRYGVRRTTYHQRTVNGVSGEPERVATEVVRKPLPRHVRVGTGEPPTGPADPADGDGPDRRAPTACASDGPADAGHPSGPYGGLPRPDTRDWRAPDDEGGTRRAHAAEQGPRAGKPYVPQGAAEWPVCARKLHR